MCSDKFSEVYFSRITRLYTTEKKLDTFGDPGNIQPLNCQLLIFFECFAFIVFGHKCCHWDRI